MTVIAMTREMGSQGKDVALGIAEKLGLEVVHHELVERDLAGRLKLGESAVHQFLEGNPSLWDRWKIDKERLSRYTAEEILDLANKGKVIIRGWGAANLLRRVSHVLCVRVCAPMRVRTEVMMERLGVSDRAAVERDIAQNDAAHARTIQNLFASDWEHPLSYDLVLNTERVPISECIEQVQRLVECTAFKETIESKQILVDILLETKIQNKLTGELRASPMSRGIEVVVTEGRVVLAGTTTDASAVEAARHIAATTDRVRHVVSNVKVIGSVMYGGM